MKAAAYTGARIIAVPHPSLAAGSPCPGHCGGRLFRLPSPSAIIRITVGFRCRSLDARGTSFGRLARGRPLGGA